MARTFRRQRQTTPISDLNVTNLVDLGFTLLIIFMIATPLINQEQAIRVNLPTESQRAQDTPDQKLRFQTISINQDGMHYWGNRQIQFSELSELLAQEADWTLQYQKVITLMDEIKKHKLSKITFDTQTTD